MAIVVQHGYFDEDQQAFDEIQKDGYYGSKFDATPSGGTPIHWHDVSMHIYITEGIFRFQDPATGKVHECVAGTRFDIPETYLTYRGRALRIHGNRRHVESGSATAFRASTGRTRPRRVRNSKTSYVLESVNANN